MKTGLLLVFVVGLVVAPASAVQPTTRGSLVTQGSGLQLVLVPGTRCLDGSQAGFYHDFADFASCSSVTIRLEGGGNCDTEESCAERAKTNLGSSNGWASSMSSDDTASLDCSTNPYFCRSCHVFVPYCTGDVHAGTSAEKDKEWDRFYFSGHFNLDAIVDTLQAEWASKLGPLTHVLLHGVSAGGFGTWVNLDWFADKVHTTYPSAVVKGSPIAGWFFPGEPNSEQPTGECPEYVDDYAHFHSGSSGCRFCSGELMDLYQSAPLRNVTCVHHFPDKEFVCSNAHIAIRYIRTPMFVGQNQFDSNQLFEQLGCPRSGADDYISYFGRASNDSMTHLLAVPHAGAFVPSCTAHGANLISNHYAISNHSFVDALGDWFWNGDGATTPRFLFDSCVSSDGGPCGANCAHDDS